MRACQRSAPAYHAGLRISFVWLIAAVINLLVLFPASGWAAAPAPSTAIENTASYGYQNLNTPLQSNKVTVLVQPHETLSLIASQQVPALPGATATLYHTLTNTGNTASTYSLALASLGGNGYNIQSLTLYRNIGNTGTLAPTDPVIPAGGTITLNPGESAILVITGTVPASAPAGTSAGISITATSSLQGVTAANTDTILCEAPARLQLTKSASTLTPQPGDSVTFTINVTNTGGVPATGTGTASGNQLLVNGSTTQLVLTRDIIPVNTAYLAGSLICPAGATPLFHRSGDPAFSYVTAEPALADEIACGLPSVAINNALSLSFGTRINLNATGKIDNMARAFYIDNAPGVASPPQPKTADSNMVELTLPNLPPTINFFKDATYTQPAVVSTVGTPLLVQVNAPQCNADPLAIETKTVTITSALTGDIESFTAVENGPNTGVFRIVPNIPARDAGLNAVIQGNGIIEEYQNDTLTASIQGCGTASASTTLFIDPMGVVFDSHSNAPLTGVQVTLIDVTGLGNGNPGGPAKVFNLDGTPAAATVTTTADGAFHFPLVPASTYQLKVVAADGYRFPSTVPKGLLPAGRAIDASGSYGGLFQVSAATGFVRMDLPLDQLPLGGLFVEKNASVQFAELGDFVDYTVKIRNGTGKDLPQVTLNDSLPAGFSYQRGTARLNAALSPDPQGGIGPSLAFAIGPMTNGTVATLTYRVKIGPGAVEGDGINHARATDIGGTASNTASAVVKVQGGVFSDKGFIIGKVFMDCNRNRLQDPEELGIPGVRLYMEDGTFVITDSEGKFSLYNISPRTHVLKIDNTTMPAGSELIELSNRNAGDAGSLFIDMKSGELHKANFAEGSCSAEVLKEVKARRAKGAVFKAEDELSLARQLSFDTATGIAGDLKGRPSSGVISGDNNGAASASPKAEQAPAPSAGTPQPSTPTPQPELETLSFSGDNSLAIISPKDHDILETSQTPIRIKGPLGVTFKLLVNGSEVSDKQLAKNVVDSARKIQLQEYLGVDLVPGINEIKLVQFDPFGNKRGEKVIKVTAPGNLAKVVIEVPDGYFAADGHTPVPVTVRLTDANGVPVTLKTPLTLESSLGRWQAADLDEKEPGTQVMIQGGKTVLLLTPPQEPGEAIIRISAGSIKSEHKLFFTADLRPMIATGLVEGAINLRSLGGSAMVPARAQDGFEQELRTYSFSGGDGKTQGGARAALFLKGKVKGDYLLTLSYDSDKDTREALFRDIQPDQFYPVYGDSSVKGFDAQSTGKLYVRIDKNKSYLLYGDYITPTSDARVLGAYNRSLNGFRGHYENGVVSANGFASNDTSTQVVEELAGQGISGPYLLSKSNFIANSEKVEIITRDRTQPSLVLKSIPQTRFTDYEIDNISGRLLFKSPVPTLDQNMNPNYIRVTYETDQGGDKFWVGGVDAQAKLHPKVEVGGSYVRDENPQDKSDLKSANTTIKLFDKTYLVGEWAQAFKESTGRGDAERFELRHSGEKLQLRVYGVRTDAAFVNPSSTYGPGRKEAGANVTYKATQATTIVGEALHSEDSVSGGKKDGVMVNVQHNFAKFLQAELGVRHAHETATPSQPAGAALTPNEFTSLRTRLAGKIPQLPKLSLTGEYEQSLEYGNRRMAAGGAEYQLDAMGKLYARHEFVSSLAGPYSLNGSQQQNSTQVGIDTQYMKDGKVFSEYRIRDAVAGRDAEAAIGLRNGWNIAKGIKLNTTLERVQKLGGVTDNTATAVTGALEYTASPLWKGTVRLEYRASTTNDVYLNTFGVAYKMSRNITLLGKQFLSYTDNKGLTGDIVQERLQGGFAFRPTDTDIWNVLTRYEFKYEKNGATAGLAGDRTVHIISTHLNYQPTKSLTTSARYAGKLVTENSNGLASTSNTHMLSGRSIYDLTSKWDAGLNYSALFSDFFKSCRYGAGGEVGYLVATNLWLSTGYNVFGFKDKDLSAEEYTNQGVYIRLRFKFDEDLFSWNDPKVNKTLPTKEIASAGR